MNPVQYWFVSKAYTLFTELAGLRFPSTRSLGAQTVQAIWKSAQVSPGYHL